VMRSLVNIMNKNKERFEFINGT